MLNLKSFTLYKAFLCKYININILNWILILYFELYWPIWISAELENSLRFCAVIHYCFCCCISSDEWHGLGCCDWTHAGWYAVPRGDRSRRPTESPVGGLNPPPIRPFTTAHSISYIILNHLVTVVFCLWLFCRIQNIFLTSQLAVLIFLFVFYETSPCIRLWCW